MLAFLRPSPRFGALIRKLIHLVYSLCVRREVSMELDLALRLLLSYFQGSHMQRVRAKEEPGCHSDLFLKHILCVYGSFKPPC